tara:strand:+ start:415 stop:579 length:165 start_codon:yes stop_codon:yes gene_type:complete
MTQDKIDILEKRISGLELLVDRLKWQLSSASDQLSDLRGDLSLLQNHAKEDESE